ncbi:DUF427 domain-containing protein [Phytohabitans rumicis]|uniref:DUF427 domain-containing protein n=1 Tax=Phytohabitans rumicis TaxID=1076125 RepID=A0A6V8LEV2_9ACTN|nr:DUF427 domain-containing protein [Phytohabitans rumicis]GFJ94804.1 hypothetical protein Prum_084460 [Phytohabitans rumicis]
MALTMGTGPFGHAPAGVFAPELPRAGSVLIDPYPRRMRGLVAGEPIVDSARGQLLHEPGRLPRCYFPPEDVRMDLLEPAGAGKPSAFLGASELWHLRLGDRFVERAALAYPAPPPEAERLRGLVALFWRAMDEWYEEELLAIAHVRDPYHRVDALQSSRHVRVSLDGVTLAESHRATVIYETGLVPRWYFPIEDVVAPLTPTEHTTRCAYKGEAVYWSVLVGDAPYVNLAWTYREPRPDAAPARDQVAFFNERVDVDVDGVRETRPGGPWANPDWWRDRSFENDL